GRGQLVLELVAGTAPAAAFGVAALQHEAGDDAVEHDPVEVVVPGQHHEVVHRLGCGDGIEGDHHRPVGRDHLGRVALGRVDAHGGRPVEALLLGAGAVGGGAFGGHSGYDSLMSMVLM